MLYKYYSFYCEKWFAVKQNVELNEEQSLLFNLRQCFFYAFGKFFNQGLEFETQHIPSRIVVVSWSLFTIVTVASYTANLTAFLTNSQKSSFMNNLNDLVRLSRYKPYLFIDSSTDYFLTVMISSIFLLFIRVHLNEEKKSIRTMRSHKRWTRKLTANTSRRWKRIFTISSKKRTMFSWAMLLCFRTTRLVFAIWPFLRRVSTVSAMVRVFSSIYVFPLF